MRDTAEKDRNEIARLKGQLEVVKEGPASQKGGKGKGKETEAFNGGKWVHEAVVEFDEKQRIFEAMIMYRGI